VDVEVVVMVALMMVELLIGDSNPNNKDLPLDLQVGLIGEACQIPTIAKFADLLAHLDPVWVVLQSKMALFGLVVHQEVVDGEMICQMAKWAMVAEMAAVVEGLDGVTSTPRGNPLSGLTVLAPVAGTVVLVIQWVQPTEACTVPVLAGVLEKIPTLMDRLVGPPITQASKLQVGPRNPHPPMMACPI
jgi:hypothetical protein